MMVENGSPPTRRIGRTSTSMKSVNGNDTRLSGRRVQRPSGAGREVGRRHDDVRASTDARSDDGRREDRTRLPELNFVRTGGKNATNHRNRPRKVAGKDGRRRARRPSCRNPYGGRIRRLKWVILILTLAVYYVVPFLQFIGGMRSLADQRLQIGGRHPQVARDPAEVGGVDLAHFPQLAPVLQPFAEQSWQGSLVAGMAQDERRSGAGRCAGAKRECDGDNLRFKHHAIGCRP